MNSQRDHAMVTAPCDCLKCFFALPRLHIWSSGLSVQSRRVIAPRMHDEWLRLAWHELHFSGVHNLMQRIFQNSSLID
jgi:hypothetical protein